jgi:hypothetical protein
MSAVCARCLLLPDYVLAKSVGVELVVAELLLKLRFMLKLFTDLREPVIVHFLHIFAIRKVVLLKLSSGQDQLVCSVVLKHYLHLGIFYRSVRVIKSQVLINLPSEILY